MPINAAPDTMHALYFSEFGGPEVLQYGTLPLPEVLPGTVLLRTRAIGLNYADVYRRRGNYHLVGQPPYLLGYEAAGEVVAVGPGVTGAHVGQRAAFADVPHANAEFVRVPQEHLIPLPDDVSFEQAAAVLLQGLTAQYLTADSYRLQPNDLAVVHAVAGGVGLLLTQLIRAKGGRVIGLTSSEAKRQEALRAGAEAVFLYTEPWERLVLEYRPERPGADVVYESVGSTLPQSLAATRVGGTVVFFGMAGGDPAPVDPRYLMDTSKTLTGGDLWNYLTSREERTARANVLFDLLRNGQLTASIGAAFPLAEGAEAHRLLESRKSTGKILLLP
ncbi:quinone oxidoreductase [Hymenobacter sp. BT770]|uniref:quinone oxidoreductase family protein n=1 Tax=Hymenobacter sp. BT770 TaxID=2886942 RepID=UPI001D10C6CB|nr:quinone oxidoreductase [Hymenobacter sp. BT770]MCC3153117.1 quinone oxidoreductase [Hymenobacter sp. BT770]MDO3415409.1 quinone oxidoreductase [Hymenobacter sp. BT770]